MLDEKIPAMSGDFKPVDVDQFVNAPCRDGTD